MADVLKVLMMGGRRVGKTSVLAGLIDNMTRGPVKNLLEVKDVSAKADVTLNLEKSVEELKSYLKTSRGEIFLPGNEATTRSFDDYTLQFRIPNSKNEMEIQFTDANGEFYESGRNHDSEIRKLVASSDVFVIVIDTPFLMEAINPDNALCGESNNRLYNHIDDIQSFMTNMDDKEGNDPKLVIFAPIKCEKWVQEGRVGEILDRVKVCYDTIITNLKSYNVEIDIMPIQTAGTIWFVEQTKALVCLSSDQTSSRRCALIDDKTRIRFEQGEVVPYDPKRHRILPDANAAFNKIKQPNNWFTTIDKEYRPKHCDQLAFYILQFHLAKIIYAQKAQKAQKKEPWYSRWNPFRRIGESNFIARNPLLLFILGLFSLLLKKLGSISLDQLQFVIEKLKSGNYIKRDCDGIVTLKKSTLEY